MPLNAFTLQGYVNHFFIETGTYMGEAIEAALGVGFADIRSVELSRPLYEAACVRFARMPHVRLWLGESANVLPDMLADVDRPATFWLDAHYSGGVTAHGRVVCPLLDELAVIAGHPIRNHTLLIDDIRLLGNLMPVTREAVEAAIYAINPNYKLHTIEGSRPDLGRDILVAIP